MPGQAAFQGVLAEHRQNPANTTPPMIKEKRTTSLLRLRKITPLFMIMGNNISGKGQEQVKDRNRSRTGTGEGVIGGLSDPLKSQPRGPSYSAQANRTLPGLPGGPHEFLPARPRPQSDLEDGQHLLSGSQTIHRFNKYASEKLGSSD
jgi:hypothetical protein